MSLKRRGVDSNVLQEQVDIGGLRTRNRLIRAGTAETMADEVGRVTPGLVDLYSSLATGAVGMLITGHLFVNKLGQGSKWQLGIDNDDKVDGLSILTSSVSPFGAPILAQLSHAGSQSRIYDLEPVGPSPVPNPLTGRVPKELLHQGIESVVRDFAAAATRAVVAGFDGVHIHGANGYLISEFCSPVTNLRDDVWGGSPSRRARLAVAIVEAIRSAVPSDFPVTFKLGAIDSVDGGVNLEESIAMARSLEAAGVDAFEVSCGLMSNPSDSAQKSVGVSRGRAVRDLLASSLFAVSEPEATFRSASRAVRSAVGVPVILTGGIRSTEMMRSLIVEGDADLIGLSRPLIRQPDLVSLIVAGAAHEPTCTSCNLCLEHSGEDPLQCWRYPKRRLLAHYWSRLSN